MNRRQESGILVIAILVLLLVAAILVAVEAM